jgi:hypothetical protein
MKHLKQKKLVRKTVMLLFVVLSLSAIKVKAQDYIYYDFGVIENIQDDNMDYMKQIYKIIRDYPSFSYTYEMEDGDVKNVTVTGVDNDLDKKRLEVVLFDLKSNKNMLKSKANRMGVFYSVDKYAQYKFGQEALQDKLHENLKYPEDAKDWCVEGTVFVKFVVDENGNIPFATASENIETSIDAYVDDLKKQAVSAIKATSGNWSPGEINGVSVSTLAVIPITFDFKKTPGIPALIR